MLRQCRATDHYWTGPVQPGLFALQGIPSRGRKADPIPGRIFQHHQSPQLRPAQHEYFFVAYDSRRHCGSDYRNGDDGAADTIGPEAHLLSEGLCTRNISRALIERPFYVAVACQPQIVAMRFSFFSPEISKGIIP